MVWDIEIEEGERYFLGQSQQGVGESHYVALQGDAFDLRTQKISSLAGGKRWKMLNNFFSVSIDWFVKKR